MRHYTIAWVQASFAVRLGNIELGINSWGVLIAPGRGGSCALRGGRPTTCPQHAGGVKRARIDSPRACSLTLIDCKGKFETRRKWRHFACRRDWRGVAGQGAGMYAFGRGLTRRGLHCSPHRGPGWLQHLALLPSRSPRQRCLGTARQHRTEKCRPRRNLTPERGGPKRSIRPSCSQPARSGWSQFGQCTRSSVSCGAGAPRNRTNNPTGKHKVGRAQIWMTISHG